MRPTPSLDNGKVVRPPANPCNPAFAKKPMNYGLFLGILTQSLTSAFENRLRFRFSEPRRRSFRQVMNRLNLPRRSRPLRASIAADSVAPRSLQRLPLCWTSPVRCSLGIVAEWRSQTKNPEQKRHCVTRRNCLMNCRQIVDHQ